MTDAVGGMIRLRALVSAGDAGSLWDLRCLVRERLVAWVFEHRRDALPRLRADVANEEPVAPDRPAVPAQAGSDAPDDGRVFGGAGDGDERAATFGGPEEPSRASTSGMRQ